MTPKLSGTLAYAWEANGIAGKVSRLLLTTTVFRAMQAVGVHLTPVHFYSPIPDLRELGKRDDLWEIRANLPGVDMREAAQRDLMLNRFAHFRQECDYPADGSGIEGSYYTDNAYFGYGSAVAMHAMIRSGRPRRVVEVGAGFSTLVIAGAARKNSGAGYPIEVVAIDPHPPDVLGESAPGLSSLIPSPVQGVDRRIFDALDRNDILSIDTSHAVRTGGEVCYLYLEILPRLRPGVLVHVHDIFLPSEYPRDWVMGRRFWNEQYLLHAFLVGNALFEVVWGQHYSLVFHPREYLEAFGTRGLEELPSIASSFWIRRSTGAG